MLPSSMIQRRVSRATHVKLQLLLAVLFHCLSATGASKHACNSTYTIEHTKEQNGYVIATSVFGVASLIVCGCVVAVIIAYKKDQFYLRERIILGFIQVALRALFNMHCPYCNGACGCSRCMTHLPHAHYKT